MTTTVTPEIAEAIFEDDGELGHGFGYIGARRNQLTSTDPECPPQPTLVAEIDALLADYFVANGWTVDEVFDWADSKLGRWFGDVVFSGGAFDQAIGFNLLAKVDA